MEELKFKPAEWWQNKMSVIEIDGNIRIEFECQSEDNSYPYFDLDRNQAHLLMLYLQEHLK